jgi:protein-arginine kinase activator protein McsA
MVVISFMSFSRSSSSEDDVNSPDEMMEGWKSRLADRGSKRVSPEEIKRVKLAKLQRTLDYLVEQEKYEKAAEIKKMIDELNNPPAATEGENKA